MVRKSIVITGASSGFGAAFARALAKDGNQLFICARRSQRLAEVATGYSNIFVKTCDVSQQSQVQEFYHQVGQHARSLDAVIHCAAILGQLGTFDTIESGDWIGTITANVLGAHLVVRHALPLMRPGAHSRILMLSGGGAFDPMPNVSAYGISKAAIVRLVETLAVELKPRDVAVNAVAPGFAATEIHQATLAAGRERGGQHFDKTVRLMSTWDNSMDVPVNCIRYMLSDRAASLTGKTISARYDPWGEPEFDQHIDEIVASPLYSTQRTTAEHLPHSALAATLARAAERKREGRAGKETNEPDYTIASEPALTR